MTGRETPFGIYFKSLLSGVDLDTPQIKHSLKISRHDTTDTILQLDISSFIKIHICVKWTVTLE